MSYAEIDHTRRSKLKFHLTSQREVFQYVFALVYAPEPLQIVWRFMYTPRQVMCAVRGLERVKRGMKIEVQEVPHSPKWGAVNQLPLDSIFPVPRQSASGLPAPIRVYGGDVRS